MKIAISAGHFPERPGLAHNQLTEYGETILIAARLVNLLHFLGHSPYMIGTGYLERKTEQINIGKFDYGLEIHLNGGGGDGCETLYCPGSRQGEALAKRIQGNMVSRCGFRDRGIKEGWYRMDRPGVVDYPGDVDGDENINFILKYTNCPFVIIEPFFMDGPDGAVHLANQESYLRIASAITEAF